MLCDSGASVPGGRHACLLVAVVAIVLALQLVTATSASAEWWDTESAEVSGDATSQGVHGNYLLSTDKCELCHATHGSSALDKEPSLSGADGCVVCHQVGSTFSTTVINWESGGPHGAGDEASCGLSGCHVTNPHGLGGSQYAIVAAKMLNPAADIRLSAAAADPDSGITQEELNGSGTWDEATRSAVRTGYLCGIDGCHVYSMLPVLNRGYAEKRRVSARSTDGLSEDDLMTVRKTGHPTVAVANGETAFRSVSSCVSCHDQTDAATGDPHSGSTVSGYTFPHSQTAAGDSNVGAGNRAHLWMTIAANAGGDDFGYLMASSRWVVDGACLKCHRDVDNAAGVGISF